MSHQHLIVKSTSGLAEVIKHLNSLIQSLKQGNLSITTNRDAIVLRPQEPVSLELEAEAKLEKCALREKLVIEMKWMKREEPLRGNVIFMIDHVRLQEEEQLNGEENSVTSCRGNSMFQMTDRERSQGWLKTEKGEAIVETEVEEKSALPDAVPEKANIPETFNTPPPEEMGESIRSKQGAQKNRSALRKPVRRKP